MKKQKESEEPREAAPKKKMTKVPAELFVNMRTALRRVEQDSRKAGRSLHDETVLDVQAAMDGLNAWQDEKAAG